MGLINLPACQSAELRGKSSSAADCGLGSSWWKHSPHVFVIRGNKKKSGKKKKRRSRRRGKKGGGVRDVAARCSCRCGEKPLGGAVRPFRVSKPHTDGQTGKQTDSWVLSRQEEHLEKRNFSLFLFPQLS